MKRLGLLYLVFNLCQHIPRKHRGQKQLVVVSVGHELAYLPLHKQISNTHIKNFPFKKSKLKLEYMVHLMGTILSHRLTHNLRLSSMLIANFPVIEMGV